MSHATPVGLIGIGLMGMACAKRMRAAGLELLGYDVDAQKLAAFVKLGGKAASSVAEIAGKCRQVVLAVFNTDQVEETVDALVAALAAGKPPLIALCVSTCDPDRISKLYARTPVDKVRYVESPVSGTSQQTERGDALGMIGGDPAAAEEAKELLDAICPRRHHMGAAGNGGRAKLAINLILGVNRAALAEGLVFAQKLGLDPGAFLKVARESAAQSQVMDIKGPKMVSGDYSPHGFITQTRKDFLLMLEQAKERGQGLPLAETYVSIVDGCVAAGEGGLDNSAVIEEIRRRKPTTRTADYAAPGGLRRGGGLPPDQVRGNPPFYD